MKHNNNKTGELSGFYYDLQLRNPMLSVGLYPNTWEDPNKPKDDEGVKNWVEFPADLQEEDSKTIILDEKNSAVKYPYCKLPLCRSIINQDFQVTVTNEWTGFGGDEIGSFWNSMRPKAPYAKIFAEALQDMVGKSAQFENAGQAAGDNVAATVGRISKIFTEAAAGGYSAQAKYLARALDVKGTRFTYYTGTGTDFGSNFGMKFTIFPTINRYDTLSDRHGVNKDKQYLTVTDQLIGLLPYAVGDYVPVKFKALGQDVEDFVSTVMAWQTPPAGFEADIKDVDLIQKGTLKLRIGPYYAIENLVISNISINESKEMVKDPFGSGKISPLFAEVNIMLRPASKYSTVSLERFISGRASAGYMSQSAEGRDGGILNEMKRSLEKVKASNNNRLPNV